MHGMCGMPNGNRTALCHALQVRATNLQELVYKQGQAGTTKATVSITWHNNDPENGPSGYEDKEYITITRQVKIVCTEPGLDHLPAVLTI